MSRVLTTDDIKAIFELIEKLAPEWTDVFAVDDSEGAEPPKKVPLSALKTLLVPYTGASNDINIGNHDFTGINAFFDALHLSTTPASIPTDIGAVYWDDNAQTYSIVLPNGVILQVGEEMYVNVARDAVAPNPILDGTPVYTTGESGQRPKVNVARADDPAKIKVTGIATHDIANLGRITSFGLIRNVPLARKPAGETWVAGQYLWLAPTGGMTNVEPSAPTPNVRLGLIVNVTGAASFDMLVYIRPAIGIYDLYDVNGDAPIAGDVLVRGGSGYWLASNRLSNAEQGIATLNADDTTEGSVSKSIKDAVDPMKGTGWTDENLVDHEGRLGALEGDVDTGGSVLKAIKDNAEDATFTPSGDIEAVTIKGAIAELDTEKEKLANKKTSLADNSDTFYPTQKAVKTAVDLKEDKSNKVTAFQATPDDTHYPSEKLVDDRFTPIEAAITKRYGVRMTKSSGANVRLYDAANLTYRRQVDTISTPSDFSSHYPWSGIKTVKVDADKNILSIIGNANWDTTVGDVMVLIPKFYSKKWEDSLYEWSVLSNTQHDDYLPIGFMNPDGTEKPYTLVAATLTSNDGTTPHSYTDTMPTHSKPLYSTTSAFQIDALNKSTEVNWSNIDHQTWEMLTRLMCVEIGSNDVKTLIGQGINGLANSYSASNVCTVATSNANTFIMAKTRSQYFKVGMMVQIGTAYTNNSIASNRTITEIAEYDAENDTITVDGAVFTTATSSTIATWGQPLPEAQLQALGNESGYVLQFGAENKSHVCYRGIWDLWGNMWQYMSGLYRYDLQFYVCFDVTKMNVNDPRGATGWSATEIAPDLANGYLKERQTYKHPLGEIGLPSITGGTGVGSTTWWAAYLYYFSVAYMGLRAVLFGGVWSYGTLVSPFSWSGYDSPTSAGIFLGGRLIL